MLCFGSRTIIQNHGDSGVINSEMLSYWEEWFSYKQLGEEVQSEVTELDKVQKEAQQKPWEIRRNIFQVW